MQSQWNENPTASKYYIFSSTSYITDVQGLVPIASTADTNFIYTLSIEGTYYYALILLVINRFRSKGKSN